MSQPRLQSVVHHLRGLVTAEERVADAELLARFADRRDEAAFSLLVQRHGSMVLGICRRMLRLCADADDAWQATFLVLARKASAIRKQASIAAWLHGVALRVCQRSREKTQRHKHRELPADLLQPDNDDLSWREVQRILDEEIERLPDRLRQPIVLCYLEGRTRDEAAEELGWTLTTFRGRLDMARERLRKRLIKRGLTLPSALLATLLTHAGEATAIPQPLLETLLPAAVSGSASASLTPLIEGGIKAMSATKMPAMISVVLAAGLMIGGGMHFSQKQRGSVIPGTLAAAENPIAAPLKEEPAKKPVAAGDVLKDVEANADRLQVTFELLPLDPKGVANPPYPLRYVMLNVLPIPIEPHGKWPNGAPIGADARITKEQASKIVAALNKLEFFQRAASDLPAIETTGPQAKLHIRYRPDGATETKHYWRPLGWDLQMLRHLQIMRSCVDGDAAKHLDAMLESLAAERKKWEAEGLSLNKMQGDWRLLHSEWQGRSWPLANGLHGKLTITGEQIDISLVSDNKDGVLAADHRFAGKVILQAFPDQPLWLNDRDDLAQGRWLILRGTWSTSTYKGKQQDEPVWYHPEKHLLRIKIPGQVAAYFVFERDEQWGDAVEGLQIRVRPWKTKLSLGEQPAFDIDLRNRGGKEWSVTGIAPDVDVELDGKLYSFNGIVDFKATKRSLKPEEQISSWIKVSPDKNWGFEWKSGKHKVRLAYSIQGKVRLFGQILEIEIVDPKEIGWGKAVGDFQVRVRTAKTSYSPDEVPSFRLDLRSRSTREEWGNRLSQYALIEVDGTWFSAPLPDVYDLPRGGKIKGGEQIDEWVRVNLSPGVWRRSEKDWIGPAPLKLAAGKYSIRVAYPVKFNALQYYEANLKLETNAGNPNAIEAARAHVANAILKETKANRLPVSEAVEFEIVDPKEIGWGELVEGLQLRGRATKARWSIDEKPTFELDLRNRGQKQWLVGAVPRAISVEVDGLRFDFFGTIDQVFMPRTLELGGQIDKWLTVAPDKKWYRVIPDPIRKIEQQFAWTPGKHRVRLHYSFAENAHVWTAPFEIDIVDPKEVGWGKPDGDFQVRLHSAKKSYSGGELPSLILDMRNQSKNDMIVEKFASEIEVDGDWYFVPRPDILLPSRKIKAGEQIDQWADFLVDGKAWRRAAQDGIGPGPLVLTPGKHKIRAAYPVANKIRPISEVVEIEIVDPKELGWGAAAKDVQIRLRKVKSLFQPNEMPVFEIDLRNRGDKVIDAELFPPEIEFDGVWYRATSPPAGPLGLIRIKAGEQYDKWAAFLVSHDAWVRKDGIQPVQLKLTQGKHTIRAAYPVTKDIRPLTETIEFAMDDPKEVGWGEPVEGLQLRGWAIPNGVYADGTPSFNVGIRNRGDKTWKIDVAADIRVEVDGVWHGPIVRSWTARPSPYPLKPGEHNDPLISVVPNQIVWKHGKHTIRLDFAITDKVQLVTQAFDIEIADPKEVGWGEPVEGVQIRGQAASTRWLLGETPTFTIDVRNRGTTSQHMTTDISRAILEIDGVSYLHPTVWYFSTVKELKAGQQIDQWITIKAGEFWFERDKGAKAPLQWKPGKHTIRITFPIGQKLQPSTKTFEIEIVEAKP